MRFPIGAMTMGDILDRGLKMLLARLPTLYVINLLFLSPMILVLLIVPQVGQLLAGNDPQSTALAMGFGVFFAGLFLTLLLQPIGNAAILHIIAEEFKDNHVGVGAALRFALGRFLPLLGASLLAGLCIGVGFLLFVVPGFIFWIWFIFVGQVVVVEGASGGEALNRSRTLTEGYRKRIFGLLLLIIVISWIAGAAAGSLELVLPTNEHVPVGRGEGLGGGMIQVFNYRNYIINTLAAQLVNILVQCFQAVCMTLLYFDLRIRKEGYDLEMAAEQEVPTAP